MINAEQARTITEQAKAAKVETEKAKAVEYFERFTPFIEAAANDGKTCVFVTRLSLNFDDVPLTVYNYAIDLLHAEGFSTLCARDGVGIYWNK